MKKNFITGLIIGICFISCMSKHDKQHKKKVRVKEYVEHTINTTPQKDDDAMYWYMFDIDLPDGGGKEYYYTMSPSRLTSFSPSSWTRAAINPVAGKPEIEEEENEASELDPSEVPEEATEVDANEAAETGTNTDASEGSNEGSSSEGSSDGGDSGGGDGGGDGGGGD